MNHYVLVFKGCPPLISDILAAGTALTVKESYEYVLTDGMLWGILIYLVMALLISYFPPCSLKIKSSKKSFIRYKIAVIVFTFLMALEWRTSKLYRCN